MLERTIKFVCRATAICLCAAFLFTLGCSKGKSPVEPTSPDPTELATFIQSAQGDLPGHSLLGYFEVTISEDKNVEIVPQRSTSMHRVILNGREHREASKTIPERT